MLIYKSIKESSRFKPRMTRDEVKQIDRQYARSEQNRSEGDKMRALADENCRNSIKDSIKSTLRSAIKKGGTIERASDLDIELTMDGKREKINIDR